MNRKTKPLSDDDKKLFLALAKHDEAFDAGKIHGWITRDEELWDAIQFLRVRPNKDRDRRGYRLLNGLSLARIRMRRRDVDGHMLVKCRDGWCEIHPTQK